MLCTPEWTQEHIAQVKHLWLFLDYDGTLDVFAPTPEHIIPRPEVIGLLARLAQHPRIRMAVISGRPLNHVQALLPVPGIFLAGTYGVEVQTPAGETINRADYSAIRPALDLLKQRWQQLIAEREGFFLEDKDWALAIHARLAGRDEAEMVLEAARRAATLTARSGPFRLLGGHRFLEIAPRLAHKGRTVGYLLDTYPWPEAFPVYVGDDDKDEEAFGTIRMRGGIAIVVAEEPRTTQAGCRLESPPAVHRWLEALPRYLPGGSPSPKRR